VLLGERQVRPDAFHVPNDITRCMKKRGIRLPNSADWASFCARCAGGATLRLD
jgi:hypothetical protein